MTRQGGQQNAAQKAQEKTAPLNFRKGGGITKKVYNLLLPKQAP
jgi:hypothetical protein